MTQYSGWMKRRPKQPLPDEPATPCDADAPHVVMLSNLMTAALPVPVAPLPRPCFSHCSTSSPPSPRKKSGWPRRRARRPAAPTGSTCATSCGHSGSPTPTCCARLITAPSSPGNGCSASRRAQPLRPCVAVCETYNGFGHPKLSRLGNSGSPKLLRQVIDFGP